ncbi:hypothetical protein MOQ72_01455 [Saccharopolyspora sp. K220]|uniref:hypothetical protein n=1 Tax=Saccharopolyspora soli TaxID=2926618 RepID=UPI001F5AE3EE|nr:hypothetical protein [Saccharopolyspora soli]MCI2416077.1 hypothetical protein [Saccharopolyspora soli]
MGIAKRVLAAVAVGLPLLLGAAGTALAVDDEERPAKAPKPAAIHEAAEDQARKQVAQNGTVQNNINISPIIQIHNGDDSDQSAMTWTHQDNTDETEQSETALQHD